jgi:hypothetical protein
MSRPLSLFSVQAILILAIEDGSRILTKYYSNPHPPSGAHTDFPGQIAYEKGLLGACTHVSSHIKTRSDCMSREDC